MTREDLYSSSDYKEYVNRRIASLPSNGRGQLRRLAARIGVQPSVVSHVFNGPGHLSLEQAGRCTEFLELSELGAEYFVGLVQYARADSAQLKKIFSNQLRRVKNQGENEQNCWRMGDGRLNTDGQAKYYSSWHYSGLHILASLPALRTRSSIGAHLGFSLIYVNKVVDFLIEAELLNENKGILAINSHRTKAERGSPFAAKHQTNWRIQAMEFLPKQAPDNLFYSFPMSLSREDAFIVRQKILDLIRDVGERVSGSMPERAYCLNIDWFDWGDR